MGKKKKPKLYSVLAVIEGEKREADFLKYLKSIYLDEKVIKFKEDPIHGGNPDGLIGKAIKQLHFGFKRIFVWIDEDKDINKESRESLFSAWKIAPADKDAFLLCPLGKLQHTYNEQQLRNPILIVSQPVCVESLILRTLDKTVPASCAELSSDKKGRAQQINDLKSCLNQAFSKTDEYEYYSQNLTKEAIETKRTEVKELDLLISMLLI